jgi:hypothetical protein
MKYDIYIYSIGIFSLFDSLRCKLTIDYLEIIVFTSSISLLNCNGM